jgi:DNA-binding MarR family transcriptional regulator/GNAT superfamily N-acetyltransferase
MSEPRADHAAALRHFTRFYTRRTELLGEGLLESPFSLVQARLIYEIATRREVTASELARDLSLDPGYLSRLVKALETDGFITRKRASDDRRSYVLALTEFGAKTFRPLDAASSRQAETMIAHLSPSERDRLVAAMATIEALIAGQSSASGWHLRPPQVGDVGWIVHRQALLYGEEYGWDATFEGLIATIAGEFLAGFDPEREACWVADVDGRILGSVFLVRESDEVAKLRLLYVEPHARGLGVGRGLVDACIAFARDKGYQTLTLWTNDVLVSARRIYEAAGFRLVAEERHHSFGQELVGQNWDLSL